MPLTRLKWKTDLEKGVVTLNYERRVSVSKFDLVSAQLICFGMIGLATMR